jgi:hypothetical protein
MADPESLENAKRKVAERMLGRDGVHAVGLRRAEGAVSIYWDPASGGTAAKIGAQARALAEPHHVILVESPGADGPRPLGR